MATDTAQLIEDFSDPPDDELNQWAKSRRCRWAWFGSLAICPLLMFFLGIVYGHPPVSQRILNPFSRPWPAKAVEVLAWIHLGLSPTAMVASIWVWGRYWWLGWAFVLLVLYLTATITVTVAMMVIEFV